jgi:hypothetical protein
MVCAWLVAASLSGVNPWLTINYGAAYTRAVLSWPDGTWTMLPFDGMGALSSAVHVSDIGLVAGAAAWRQAETDPDGFVLSPLRAGDGHVRAGGREVEVTALAAATLRHVGEEAARLSGEPVGQVRVVVPSGWGPRRRTWLRQAAAQAGLPVSEMVSTAVSALRAAPDMPDQPGSVVLVIDVGAGCEISVLLRDTAGFDTLSILDDPAAGGDRIDAALMTSITGGDLDAVPAQQRWPTLAVIRAAAQALQNQPAVTAPLPGGQPAAVLSAAVLRQAAQPSAERVADLAAQALANADLSIERVDAVYAIGGAAPAMMDLVADKLGTLPRVLEHPASAAVRGAADASTASATDAVGAQPPPLRRLISLALPGVASLLLYAHFVFSAEFYNGTPQAPRPYFYALAAWGELTVAGVLVLVALLQAGPVLALVQHQQQGRPARGGFAGGPITAGLAMAVTGGVAIAGLYAVVAAVYLGQPPTALLKWALAPALPTAAAGALLVVLAWRQGRAPEHGWDRFLTFPVSSVLAGAAGIAGLALSWHGRLSALGGWSDLLAAAGATLVAVALACTATRHPGLRVGLAVLLSLLLLIISRSGPSIPAVVYALAVAGWWVQRAWALLRLQVAHAS